MQALGKDRPRLSMPSLVISKLIFHKSLQSPSLFVSFQVLGLASCHAADRMLPGRGYEGLLYQTVRKLCQRILAHVDSQSLTRCLFGRL
jgi:hypothetical protein